jgi:hypothetical protein
MRHDAPADAHNAPEAQRAAPPDGSGSTPWHSDTPEAPHGPQILLVAAKSGAEASAPNWIGCGRCDTRWTGLRACRSGLQARKSDLAALFAAGDIDAAQLKRGSLELQAQLDGIETRLATARASSALADVVLSGDDLTQT